MSNPTAFFSYSWDDEQYKELVASWATRLRGDGIDVKLDKWQVVSGDQLPLFMEREIRENSFILIACTPRYKKRADNREGGVGYEGDIMTAEAMNLGNHRKFIPILARGTWNEAAPTWLSGKDYIDFSNALRFEAQYERLLRTLTGQLSLPPTLGPVRDLNSRPSQVVHPSVTIPFPKEEAEILFNAKDRGELWLLKVDAFGTWVRSGKKDFFDAKDPAFIAIYMEAFASLHKKGLVKYYDGDMWRLTGSGFIRARELAKEFESEIKETTSTPKITDLPKASKLVKSHIQYRSDADAFELVCMAADRGQGAEKWCLDIEGIGMREKTPKPIEFGNRYGQFWVTFNGSTYGATLECIGYYENHAVKFRLKTIINDPTFWALD